MMITLCSSSSGWEKTALWLTPSTNSALPLLLVPDPYCFDGDEKNKAQWDAASVFPEAEKAALSVSKMPPSEPVSMCAPHKIILLYTYVRRLAMCAQRTHV